MERDRLKLSRIFDSQRIFVSHSDAAFHIAKCFLVCKLVLVTDAISKLHLLISQYDFDFCWEFFYWV
jgi:hypothetical protein